MAIILAVYMRDGPLRAAHFRHAGEGRCARPRM